MDNPGVWIRRAVWPEEAAAIALVRDRVFVQELGIPAELEWETPEPPAWWVIAETGPGQPVEPVGTGRLLPSGQIGRMAVLPSWRRQGLGGLLLKALLQIADDQGHLRPWLKAQTSAIGFYRRHGFIPVGEIFDEAGIPHQSMRYEGQQR